MSNQRYYWLKLKRDFFKRHDITIIEGMQNGKDYVLFYLKLLCESVDHEGNLRFSETIPYNEEMLSAITRTNVDIVRSAIKLFRQLDLIEIMDDGTLYLNEVQKMLGSETGWAEKKRAFREAAAAKAIEDKKGQSEDNVPDDVRTNKDNVRQEKEKEIEKELEIEKEKKRPAEPTVASTIAESGLAENVQEALREFSKMRTKIKATMTANAMRLLINSLKKLSNDPATQEAILNQSIENSWKGVYPLKNEPERKPEPKPTGKFYGFEEHPHTAQSDADFEAQLLKKQREERERKRREQ